MEMIVSTRVRECNPTLQIYKKLQIYISISVLFYNFKASFSHRANACLLLFFRLLLWKETFFESIVFQYCPGIVVIASAYRTEASEFESRQVVRFLGP
jgi:hypothetical protein